MTKRSTPAALLCLLSAGCYTYQPIAVGPETPRVVLRATLSAEASPALTSMLGPSAARVEGMLRAQDDSSFTMAVSSLTRQSGVEEGWNGEAVRLMRRDVTGVSVQTFSRSRTTLLAAGAVGGALLAATAFRGGGDAATLVIPPAPPSK